MENNSQLRDTLKQKLGYNYLKKVHSHCPETITYNQVYNVLNGRCNKKMDNELPILTAAQKAIEEVNEAIRIRTQILKSTAA